MELIQLDRNLLYFHIDIAEVHTENGRLQIFVATDRMRKLAHADLHEEKTAAIAALASRHRLGHPLNTPSFPAV